MTPQRDAVTAYVSLGANLGQPDLALRQALAALVATAGVCEVRASSLYRSAPVDAGGPWYCNAVAEVHTHLSAPELLAVLQALENAAGRERPYRNAPRTLDLDLLLYGTASIDSPALTVPHPRMRQRAFVLLPLRELAPQWVSADDLAALGDQAIELWPGEGP
jgi:2-amino-4-hydroxy-6-hydroxymethyldihydropteridine diphosphokinase